MMYHYFLLFTVLCYVTLLYCILVPKCDNKERKHDDTIRRYLFYVMACVMLLLRHATVKEVNKNISYCLLY